MGNASFVLCAILLFLAFAISEIEADIAPKLCEKLSNTFSGKCDRKKCDLKCVEEKAILGACNKRKGKDACFCYFDCLKAPPPPRRPPAQPAHPVCPPPPPPHVASPPPPPIIRSPAPPSMCGPPTWPMVRSSPPPHVGKPPPLPATH